MLDTDNYIGYSPGTGNYKGKHYLFKESSKRFTFIRNFASRRAHYYKDHRYLLIQGMRDDKVEFGLYSETVYNDKLGLPEAIYDIKRDKVYILEGQLWELDKKDNNKN
jgi:hypothetical protein